MKNLLVIISLTLFSITNCYSQDVQQSIFNKEEFYLKCSRNDFSVMSVGVWNHQKFLTISFTDFSRVNYSIDKIDRTQKNTIVLMLQNQTDDTTAKCIIDDFTDHFLISIIFSNGTSINLTAYQ